MKKYFAFLGTIAIVMAIYFGLCFAQGDTETITATLPTALITISGVICPLIVKYACALVKNTKGRWWIATVLSGIWGLIGVTIAKQFNPQVDLVQTVMMVILMSKLSYHNFFHDLIKKNGKVVES